MFALSKSGHRVLMTLAMAVSIGWGAFLAELALLVWLIGRRQRR
jgi:hypothetical protein